MRPYLVLILIAVTMAFSSGYLSLSLREPPADAGAVLSTISDIKEDFLKSHSPDFQFAVDRKWLAHNERFFKLPEKERKHIHPRGVLTQLDLKAVESLSHRPELVLGEHAMLFRMPYRSAPIHNAPYRGRLDSLRLRQQLRQLFHQERYGLFDPKEWQQFIEAKPYVAAAYHAGDACALRQRDVCWRNNAGYFNRMAQKPAAMLMIGSVLLTLMAVRLLFKKIEFQNRAEERKRFALQSLTHELRTPLSSIIVSLETLRNQFNALPEAVQDATMHICDDVQRLQRLAEASKQYLSSHSGNAIILFQPRQIPSVHAYLENQLEHYIDRILLKLPDPDGPICLDPYWVGICLKNLVENALLHGKAPVTVRAAIEEKSLRLTVEDQGICTFSTLIKMTRPFVKGRNSQGLGLGLAIVRKVIHEMNGTLDFSPNPTCFTMRLEEQAQA